jgi:hypothetical protein
MRTTDLGDTRINLTGLEDLSGLTWHSFASPKNLWYSAFSPHGEG